MCMKRKFWRLMLFKKIIKMEVLVTSHPTSRSDNSERITRRLSARSGIPEKGKGGFSDLFQKKN